MKGGVSMTIEQKLKELIKEQYGSVSEICRQVGMPVTTLDTILKRGIANSNITNIIKITNALNISADALAEGRIEKKLTEIKIEKLTPDNKEKLPEYFELLLNSQK